MTVSGGRSTILGHALPVPSIVRILMVVSDTITNYLAGILLKIYSNSPEEYQLVIETVRMGTLERLLFVVVDAGLFSKDEAKTK